MIKKMNDKILQEDDNHAPNAFGECQDVMEAELLSRVKLARLSNCLADKSLGPSSGIGKLDVDHNDVLRSPPSS
jgi:hypothetical protein